MSGAHHVEGDLIAFDLRACGNSPSEYDVEVRVDGSVFVVDVAGPEVPADSAACSDSIRIEVPDWESRDFVDAATGASIPLDARADE